MRILCLADSKLEVTDKINFYAHMAGRMMVKCLPVVEISFTCATSDGFRSILSQDGLTVERVADATSDDDDSL